MKNLLKLTGAILLVSAMPSFADTTLFSQDFTTSTGAGANYTTHGDGVFTFNDNNDAQIASGESRAGFFRTNAANSFVDDGTATVTYNEEFGTSGGGGQIAGLVFRMDGTGATASTTTAAFDQSVVTTGYVVDEYWDGGTEALQVLRYNNGVSTLLDSVAGTFPVLATYGPGTLSVAVTDTATAVDLSISYEGTFLTDISDTGAGRLTSGQGIGAFELNNGTPGSLSAQFYSLSAISAASVPEPNQTAMLIGSMLVLGVMVRRKMVKI